MMRNHASVIVWAACLAAAAHSAEKPYSFGRFGFGDSDGLLTVDTRPTGLIFRNGQAAPSAISWQPVRMVSVSATEKTFAGSGSTDCPKSVRCTLLYPGVETKWGKTASVRLFNLTSVSLDGRPPAPVPEGWLTLKTPDVVLSMEGALPGTPVIVTFDPLPRRIRFMRLNGEPSLSLEAEAEKPIKVRFTVPSLGRPKLNDPLSVRAFIRLVDTHAPIPRLVRETYRYDRKSGKVTITDEYMPANARIVLPPVLAFAASHGYPVKPMAPGLIFCKYGPLVFGGANGKFTYTLPVPPIPERGYLRPAADDPLQPLLNEICGHWPAAWCRNGVDLGYAGVANAAMAWNLLSRDNRVKARQVWQTYLDGAFSLPPYKPDAKVKPWKTMTEPFTGKSFLWGYSIDNKVRQCDLEWGIGLPLYGLYKYGTVTGDWQRVKRHWPAAQRLAGYFDLADDYAWMTVCNAQDGYSTGTGDALNAAYAGMTAMLGMSRRLGDTNAEAKYAYRLARVALATSMRPAYTKWARAHGLLGPSEAALGFWEAGDSFTPGDFNGDPWSTTTLLSGNGCIPELMSLYAWSQPSAWRGFLNEYARYYPQWYDGSHAYDYPTTYDGNSGYVTYPHLFARAWFGAGGDELREWLEAAQGNRRNAWVGPNAVAEIITRDAPVVMNGWGDAPLPSGTWTKRTAKIQVNAKRATILQMEPRRNIRSVSRNGRSSSFVLEDLTTGPSLSIPVPAGSHTISIQFD